MPSEGLSYQFAQAVARQPSRSVVKGLRATDRGTPNIERFQAEHKAYISALERAGLKVTVLGAEEAFPDSVFIEDAALCLPQGTVILRPGAPSRTGEGDLVATDMAGLGHKILPNDSAGFIDGGDILVTDSAILVGLSKRTNQDGFDWLKTVLAAWGYTALAVHTPDNVLHFKSDCCVLDSNTILATSRLAGAECFANFRVLTVPAGEEAAANSIRVNDKVLLPAGYPATAALLSRENFAIETLRVSQAALLDGGLSCMSLRF
jgi:dimethylargininase